MKSVDSEIRSPFQTIVVGVDFSDYSIIVVRQAQKLAEQFKAKIILFHAAQLDWQMAGPEVYIAETSLKDLKKSIEKFYRVKASPSLEIDVRRGDPEKTILKVAHRLPEPLLMVGSQGGNVVSRFVLGSQAEKIALTSSVPVWVHRGNKIVSFKRILVPSDLSKNSVAQIKEIQMWKASMPISVQYIFVRPTTDPNLDYPAYVQLSQKMQKQIEKSISQFQRQMPEIPISIEFGNEPSENIRLLAKKFDVIAMTPHNYSGLLNRFGRVTAKVIRISDKPVLILKPQLLPSRTKSDRLQKSASSSQNIFPPENEIQGAHSLNSPYLGSMNSIGATSLFCDSQNFS